MKAWMLHDFRGVEGLKLADVPDPVPGDGEVVIDLEFAAVNPADAYLAQGKYPAQPKLPHVLGRDGVGVISSAGFASGPFHPGQRVLVIRGHTGVSRWGTFAQKVVVSTLSIATPPADWTVSESAGAALVYLTAYQALTQWGDLPPSLLLITGSSGGVGIASIQLGKALGHTVVALSRGTAKREKLKQLGADHVIDATEPDWPLRLKQSLSPRKVELAIDNIGGSTFPQVVETMAFAGKISVVGQLAGPVPNFSTATLYFRRLRVGGVAVGTYAPAEARQVWEKIVTLLAKTGAKPIVDQIFPFESLPAAFKRLSVGPLGKVLIQMAK